MKIPEIYFASPDRLIYLPVFLFFVFMLFRRHGQFMNFVKALSHREHRSQLFKNFSPFVSGLKLFFFLLAICMIAISIFRPQWNKKEEAVVQEGRDLLIMLDISRSMLAKDLKPNRLEFAKSKIRTLVSEKLGTERVGLILFSGSAFLQCPLTADRSAFFSFLDAVSVETVSSGTTSIDKALMEAVRVYARSSGRKTRLAMLVTDGEDFCTRLDIVKRQAKDYGMTLIAYGVGTEEGAPVPKFDMEGNQIGHETDENGKIAVTKLNVSALKKISNYLDGLFVLGKRADSDLDQIVSFVNRFEKEKFEERSVSAYEDQYPLFLGVAWLLLALEWIL